MTRKTADAEAVSNIVDDGIQDVEPNRPVVGQWVDLPDGRHAAYLENVEANKDGSPKTVLVQTRDADNLTLEVPYADVVLSTYHGGR